MLSILVTLGRLSFELSFFTYNFSLRENEAYFVNKYIILVAHLYRVSLLSAAEIVDADFPSHIK
jgi:hypothetical protein